MNTLFARRVSIVVIAGPVCVVALGQPAPPTDEHPMHADFNEDLGFEQDQHVVVQPPDDVSVVPLARVRRPPAVEAPNAGGGPGVRQTLVVNTRSLSPDPGAGLTSITSALRTADADGTATVIMFDPAVFATGNGPLFTDVPLLLNGDGDMIDGTGAEVIFHPLSAASDDSFGVGFTGVAQRLRNVQVRGYSVAGVIVSDAAASASILNVVIENIGLHGVLVRKSASVTLIGSTVDGTGDDGIRVENASATIRSCTVSGAGDNGISVRNGDLRLESSTITGAGGYGLLFSGDTPGTMSFPTLDVQWGCGFISMGGNNFDPGNTLTWFIHPQVPIVPDILIPPGALQPDPLELSQDVEFYLPFTNGQTTSINQSYNGEFSHDNDVALDLGLPLGPDDTAVRACAQGRVIRTLNFQDGPGANKKGNTVTVDHGGGIVGVYTHLLLDSIQVVPGQLVARYQILGYGESSGNSTGPHLHLEFYKFRNSRLWEEFSFPPDPPALPPWEVKFEDVINANGGTPIIGESHTSGNSVENNPPPFVDSHFAADLFRDRDDSNILDDPPIELLTKVPMAYYHTDQQYYFHGQAPPGAAVVRLFVYDYVTREEVEHIDAPVDANDRFRIGLNLCENMAGPYLISLDAAPAAADSKWEFDIYSEDRYAIIFVGQAGTTSTPPYYASGALCFTPDPAADDDGDGIPNANDHWFNVDVTTTNYDDLAGALYDANVDCRRTLVRFHPAWFPENNPRTIYFERDVKFGNDGDLLDASGAGVIFRPLDEDTNRAMTLTGTQGVTIRNVAFYDWDDQGVVSVSYRSKLWTNGCDIVQDAAGSGNALSCGDKSNVRWANGDIFGNLANSAVVVGDEADFTASGAGIVRGYHGLSISPGARITLNNVDISNVDQAAVNCDGATLQAKDLLLLGNYATSTLRALADADITLIDAEIAIGVNGIYMQDQATGAVNRVEIYAADSDGIELQDDAVLELYNGDIHGIDRGLALFDTSTLRVCENTITSINPGEVFFSPDNRVHGYSSDSHYFGPDSSYVGGYSTPPEIADDDGNGVLDLTDFAAFQGCLSGPDPILGDQRTTGGPNCLFLMDLQGDGDVDFADFAELQVLW